MRSLGGFTGLTAIHTHTQMPACINPVTNKHSAKPAVFIRLEAAADVL